MLHAIFYLEMKLLLENLKICYLTTQLFVMFLTKILSFILQSHTYCICRFILYYALYLIFMGVRMA